MKDARVYAAHAEAEDDLQRAQTYATLAQAAATSGVAEVLERIENALDSLVLQAVNR